ncbi:17495_t:CDS:2 [Entrophospora sp. SA101]|nr:17495_t:CDS:2 [Entrophospora sp. SA101]CAJ0825481.1 4385_t:CDS:2 [Entrophospora sp. SA101]
MTLIGHQVIVELKNDLAITGILSSVDQFLNIKLDNIRVVDDAKYPHMMAVKNCFIRGSVVRYVQLPAKLISSILLVQYQFSLLLYERLEKELTKAEKELERNIGKF